jgi:uncharacterized membrane-anchored protein
MKKLWFIWIVFVLIFSITAIYYFKKKHYLNRIHEQIIYDLIEFDGINSADDVRLKSKF